MLMFKKLQEIDKFLPEVIREIEICLAKIKKIKAFFQSLYNLLQAESSYLAERILGDHNEFKSLNVKKFQKET